MVYSCDVQLSECFNCTFILYDDDGDIFFVCTAWLYESVYSMYARVSTWMELSIHTQFESLSCPHYFYAF